MGQLYQRGRIWWVKYYVNGNPIRESTGTEKEKEARRFLKEREGRIAIGQPILRRADRIRYEEIAQDLRQHYATTGSRDLIEAEKRLKHLDGFFTGRRAAAIGGGEITAYVAARQGCSRCRLARDLHPDKPDKATSGGHRFNGAANGTINRELAVLTKMLRLAYENGKLLRLPVVRKLKEPPPRQGFFERKQYEAVCRKLQSDLQVAIAIAYTYGWRMQSEILTIERRQLDLEVGTLRLDPGETKNEDGRIVYLTAELELAIRDQLARVDALQRKLGRAVPYLFPHFTERLKGQRIRDFRKAWESACREAGMPGMLKHDFRRTAVRNMVNAGVPERVAMSVTGHKTRSVFDRYHIVSPGDLQEAARKLAGTISGTIREPRLTPVS